MSSSGRLSPAFSWWNWKCALLSASVRSLVYLCAMARAGSHNRLGIILVEIAYVTLTAGLYAGMQQKALQFRSRLLGNLTVGFGVPALAQVFDWFIHRAAGAAAPPKSFFAVCLFTALSAVFHLYVMRRGVFLTGQGRSLQDDFQRMPRLIACFVLKPFALFSPQSHRLVRSIESQAAL